MRAALEIPLDGARQLLPRVARESIERAAHGLELPRQRLHGGVLTPARDLRLVRPLALLAHRRGRPAEVDPLQRLDHRRKLRFARRVLRDFPLEPAASRGVFDELPFDLIDGLVDPAGVSLGELVDERELRRGVLGDALDLVLRVRLDPEKLSGERHVRDRPLPVANGGLAAVGARGGVGRTVLRARAHRRGAGAEDRADAGVDFFGVLVGDGGAEGEANEVEDAALAGAAAADEEGEELVEGEGDFAEVDAAGDGQRLDEVMGVHGGLRRTGNGWIAGVVWIPSASGGAELRGK